MECKKLRAFAPLPDYGDISDEHRQRINQTFMKYVSMLEDQAIKIEALQSDLRTLAAAVVALLGAHETRIDIHDFQRRFERARDKHAPAITLAQGILEGGE